MQPSALTCPRCRYGLYEGVAAGVSLYACGGCGGVWLHTACARRLAEHLPADAIRLARVASHHARNGADVAQAAPCPVCARPMTRSAVAMARVEIDFCPAHGTWYDRHELEAIALAMLAARSPGSAPGAIAAPVAVGAVAVGAVAVGAAVAMGPERAAESASNASSIAGDAVEVAAEVVLEGAFDVLGAIFSGIFD